MMKKFKYFGGIYTYKASEEVLGKAWLRKKEDEAWSHLQNY
jgi:hypothetical protein